MDQYHNPSVDGSPQKITTMIETPRYQENSEYLFSLAYVNVIKSILKNAEQYSKQLLIYILGK